MKPWLSVIGIGEDGLAGLSPAARALLQAAELVVGGERHLAMLPPQGGAEIAQERLSWASPLSELVSRLTEYRGRDVTVLATGDPMHFGIGATLARAFAAEEMTVHPHLSAFSLAAARLAWPLDEVETVTLHGRPLARLALRLYPGGRLLILSHDAATPAAVAALLCERGFGESRMVALSHMGGQKEARLEASAESWAGESCAGESRAGEVADFHTLAVACIAGPEADWLPRAAGLPDEAFQHDGKMTKREARALAIAKLAPYPGALLWDIGAGAGSVAIEFLRAAPQAKAIALEPRPERRAMAARNAEALGVPELDIRHGEAPGALAGLPAPDAVFVGGGVTAATLEAASAALKAGGRLVAHAVTLESEEVLLAAAAAHGGELTRLAVSRAEKVGPYRGWRPAMPVTQWAWRKGSGRKGQGG
ncbi:bifunctional cobalt-precorrin-7 (C(5))-methyltransferase/cobalt-precorrin-6B (C(15))-methyltransferase [Afifella pfennigii]|uniref:bifunctional cobalt-precorrin-7 (C(5))-methyltransferase/cobalt-precorrin-6B (C(15))-methyltransferase n=1 Tax=Afifella pfennigii TaxID=209897 RepID=UPI00047956AB|nr:bifunctional cobalt-precorrin-7 (C(5))-methyltransferase/cobalt-precorrin-6B (C(15))-methyltransferase [Afifella pfennigii]